jgi:hypothetical protein
MTLDNRRSPRIVRRVPIKLIVGDETVDAVSSVINQHGALIMAPVAISADLVVRVENLRTERLVDARVVWSIGEADGGWKIGLEFLEELDFWGSDYAPEPDEGDTRLG